MRRHTTAAESEPAPTTFAVSAADANAAFVTAHRRQIRARLNECACGRQTSHGSGVVKRCVPKRVPPRRVPAPHDKRLRSKNRNRPASGAMLRRGPALNLRSMRGPRMSQSRRHLDGLRIDGSKMKGRLPQQALRVGVPSQAEQGPYAARVPEIGRIVKGLQVAHSVPIKSLPAGGLGAIAFWDVRACGRRASHRPPAVGRVFAVDVCAAFYCPPDLLFFAIASSRPAGQGAKITAQVNLSLMGCSRGRSDGARPGGGGEGNPGAECCLYAVRRTCVCWRQHGMMQPCIHKKCKVEAMSMTWLWRAVREGDGTRDARLPAPFVRCESPQSSRGPLRWPAVPWIWVGTCRGQWRNV